MNAVRRWLASAAAALWVAGVASAAVTDALPPEGSEGSPDAVAGEAADAPPALRFDGPLELQDTFLPAQLRYQAYSESARTLLHGEWAVRVSTDWTNHLAQTDTYLFDGESVTSTLRVRHAPFPRLELGIDVPYTVRFDGTLDRFIEQVERSLDARVDSRFFLPRNEYFALVVDERGRQPILVEPEENGLGDISLRVKGQLTQAGPLGLDASVALALAVPTGQPSFGGEGVSPSLGLHLQRPFASLNPFAGVSVTYYSDAMADGLRLAPYRTMTYAGFEWRPWRWFGFVFETQLYTALTRTNPPLNEPAYYYAGGLRFYLTEQTMLELGAVENFGVVENRNSSDVTFKSSLGVRF